MFRGKCCIYRVFREVSDMCVDKWSIEFVCMIFYLVFCFFLIVSIIICFLICKNKLVVVNVF